MGRQNFIGDLCLALAHKLELERLFLILTAYMDESGTHDGSPVMTMGAALGNVAQWRKFQTRFDRLKRDHKFKVFHAKEVSKRQGEFAGWTEMQSALLFRDLEKLIHESLMFVNAFALTPEVYATYKTELHKKVRVDSKYGLAFRVCLIDLISEVARRFDHHKKFSETRLHVVCESGHANAGAVLEIFSEIKKELKEGASLLGTITFADKNQCDPLAVSDSTAYSRYVEGPELSSLLEPRSSASRRGAGLRLLHYTPDGIVQLKNSLNAKARARIDWGKSKARPLS